MTALAADLTATAGILVLDGALDVGSYPAPYTIDSECVLVTGGDGSTTPSVSRGQNGTAPATHSSGATVTSGWGGGGGVANPMTADLDTGGYNLVGDSLYLLTPTASAASVGVELGEAGAGDIASIGAGSGAAGKAGGEVLIRGGGGDAGNDAGASITVGGGDGAGNAGGIVLVGVPTADPHVVGQIWANSGVLTISAG